MEDQIFFKECVTEELVDITRYLSKAVQSHIPLLVSFELTRRCNFSCVHCYLGNQKNIRSYQEQEIDTATVIKLIDEMVATGTLFFAVAF